MQTKSLLLFCLAFAFAIKNGIYLKYISKVVVLFRIFFMYMEMEMPIIIYIYIGSLQI